MSSAEEKRRVNHDNGSSANTISNGREMTRESRREATHLSETNASPCTGMEFPQKSLVWENFEQLSQQT